MLSSLFKVLENCKIYNCVSSSIPNYILKECKTRSLSVVQIKDARSAMFEAIGMANVGNERVALLIDERYISNIYTGITEAWFQRLNILVISINADYCISLDYFSRCTVGMGFLTVQSNIDEVCNIIQSCSGPFLLRTQLKTDDDDSYDYSKVITRIENELKSGDIVSCFNPVKIFSDKNFAIKEILPKHKYCVVSKYVGSLLGLGPDKRHILCIPESLLEYDSNIYNFRDISTTFCLIILADESGMINRLSTWITSNNIRIDRIINDSERIILSKDNKSIVYIINNTDGNAY